MSGWILPEREIVRSPNYEHGRGGLVADTLVLHYAVDPDQSPDGLDDESVEFHPRARNHDCMDVARGFARRERQASAHLCIGRDGSKAQCVSLLDTAWHAGDGMLHHEGIGPLVPRIRRTMNRRSVGIELSNLGFAIKKAGLRPEEIFVGRHRNPASTSTRWEVYPGIQIDTLRSMVALLRMSMPTLRWVCGHEDVTHRDTLGRVGAKLDPGPAFPWHDIDWKDLGFTRIVYDFKMRAWVEWGNETTVVDGVVDDVK